MHAESIGEFTSLKIYVIYPPVFVTRNSDVVDNISYCNIKEDDFISVS